MTGFGWCGVVDVEGKGETAGEDDEDGLLLWIEEV